MTAQKHSVIELFGFMKGTRKHPSSKLTHEKMLKKDSLWLETQHDYIQWMFPTLESSQFNPTVPVPNYNDVEDMRKNVDLVGNMCIASLRMLLFYEDTKDAWLTHKDHNHLRITRIIKSLSLFTGDSVTRNFHKQISAMNAEAGYPVNFESVDFWNKARYYGDEQRAYQSAKGIN